MFGIFGSGKVRDWSPAEVDQGLKDAKIILVDVRELAEFQSQRIAGAIHHPLSSFEPKALPAPPSSVWSCQRPRPARSKPGRPSPSRRMAHRRLCRPLFCRSILQ